MRLIILKEWQKKNESSQFTSIGPTVLGAIIVFVLIFHSRELAFNLSGHEKLKRFFTLMNADNLFRLLSRVFLLIFFSFFKSHFIFLFVLQMCISIPSIIVIEFFKL